jgi:N-acetyl-anhydromuramyl-L-alanine amidase AmpD
MARRRTTDVIVVHCAATKASMDIGVEEIRRWHKDRGWTDIGYHFVIRRNGTVEKGRNVADVGAHVAGKNRNSIGICLVGGINDRGAPVNNFTIAQSAVLHHLIEDLLKSYPGCRIVGHRDLDPKKDCPCFDVKAWWAEE